MAEDSLLAPSGKLIAGRYAVDIAEMLPQAGGGIPAYLARDRMTANGKRVALAVSRDMSPRLIALRSLTEPVDNLMVPLAHGSAPLPGDKGDGYFVICTSPPGPPMSVGLTQWTEKTLLDLVMRPAARVLEVLHGHQLTHRSIRLNNVFQAAAGQQVTLGAAWAAPPAMHQPAVWESPYSAMCHPAGRGEGTIADDVYSLAVLLLTLWSGKVPMAAMDDETIVRGKLDLGSFGALTRDIPVAGAFGDLLRGMLAEDPDHRPQPAQLLDTSVLRGRRVTARPPRRSQHALMLNDIAVFDARMLACALLSDQKKAIQFLRNGLATQWLRRGLGDAALAAQIEDLVRGRMADTKSALRGDPMLVMQTISAINPRMPLCWRGIALWPDGLPALLAEGVTGNNDVLAVAEELLNSEIPATWTPADPHQQRPEAPDTLLHRVQGNDSPAGLLRLFYGLNPLLPCRAPGMASTWIGTVADLMTFLERTAAAAGDSLIGPHIAAFIGARADRKMEIQVNTLASLKDADAFRRAELTLLQDLQTRYHPSPMPGLAKWAAARSRPDLERWHNRPRREAMQARLDVLAQAGILSRLLELTRDTVARSLDTAGAIKAANELARINAEVEAIDNDDQLRFADAERYGQAITGGIGLSALILTAMSLLLR